MIDQNCDEIEILEEYNIWRKNVPYLYDLMFSHALQWPSLSIQYFPESKRDEKKEKTSQRLLITTNSEMTEQEYIHIASVEFPDKYDEVLSDDCGGDLSFKFDQSIPVSAPANIVRYNPLAFHLLAARFDKSEVHIYDYTKHLASSTTAEPDIILKGHNEGGFGLCWNPNIVNELSTAGDDKMICVFDVPESSNEATCKIKLKKHTKTINEISYNYYNDSILCSVSDDKSIIIWDTKTKNPCSIVKEAHDSDIYSIHCSPLNSFFLCTGSEDNSVKIWDMRNLNRPVQKLLSHSKGVGKVQWSPHSESVLASASKDRRVCLWDLSLSGNILSKEDAKDGPPELIFLHGGHTYNVFDISWNPAEPFEIASVSEDNILQIWQVPERE
ncbi:histone-binding protein RBBP7 [Vairimorpha necatrix]|uniref:Histone-binding protein RBBP7 n=1 Tax=Vairimorpha necatrix TaxID=6039 RepID=A0AAX4JAX5_9MICR